MQHSTHAPTQSEAERIAEFQWIGCVVCRLYLQPSYSYDVHHLLQGSRRMGHRFTIPLHPWFHRALVPEDCSSEAEAIRKYGPPLKYIDQFTSRFGPELELLEATDLMIAKKRGIESRPRGPRKEIQTTFVPREWTLCGAVAVKTRSMSIAAKVAEQVTTGESGMIDGTQWMSLEKYLERAA